MDWRNHMNKIAVVYKSKYGSTKRYAQILQNHLEADVIESKDAKIAQLSKYDVLVFAGGIMASGIAGLSFLKKNYEALRDKRIYLLGVGASKPREAILEEMSKRNLKGDLEGLPLFYARGKWDVEELNFVDKKMCKMLYKGLSKKAENELNEYDREFIERYYESNDWVSDDQVQPLIEAIKNR